MTNIKKFCQFNEAITPKKVTTHEDVLQTIINLEAELQEFGIEILKRYSYQLYAEVNDHFSIQLKFKILAFGHEYIIFTKYPKKNAWLWKIKKDPGSPFTRLYFETTAKLYKALKNTVV